VLNLLRKDPQERPNAAKTLEMLEFIQGGKLRKYKIVQTLKKGPKVGI
jgi:hypothetical protein